MKFIQLFMILTMIACADPNQPAEDDVNFDFSQDMTLDQDQSSEDVGLATVDEGESLPDAMAADMYVSNVDAEVVNDLQVDLSVSLDEGVEQDAFICDLNCGQWSALDEDNCECVEVDDCLTDNGGCPSSFTCENNDTVNAAPTCLCELNCPQWSRLNEDRCECEEVDDCTINNGDCPSAARCENNTTMYEPPTCVCTLVYCERWSGLNRESCACEEVDDCLVRNGGCYQSICVNSTTIYEAPTCTCEEGDVYRPVGSGNVYACRPYRVCNDNEYEVTAPTPTSDRECKPLTQCPPGSPEIVPPTDTSDRICSARNDPDEDGIFGLESIESTTIISREPGDTFTVVGLADMDRDGDQDLILANRDGQQNYIYLNDQMKFEKKIPFGTGKDETRSVAIADLNNDGWSDLILANIGEPNSICFGDASMTFKSEMLDPVQDLSFSLDVADYDQDGDIDILVGNSGEPNRLYQNSGDGKSFKLMLMSPQEFDTYDIRFVDLNKDGFMDVVEANSNAVNVYYINRVPRHKK